MFKLKNPKELLEYYFALTVKLYHLFCQSGWIHSSWVVFSGRSFRCVFIGLFDAVLLPRSDGCLKLFWVLVTLFFNFDFVIYHFLLWLRFALPWFLWIKVEHAGAYSIFLRHTFIWKNWRTDFVLFFNVLGFECWLNDSCFDPAQLCLLLIHLLVLDSNQVLQEWVIEIECFLAGTNLFSGIPSDPCARVINSWSAPEIYIKPKLEKLLM